ncbi:MAG: 4-(cytidine 5'-diphospho)-2-C-methyl-D-erythritol kinase [Lachnospiraceae bacterium]|nr:4-(cytidine 5'-diphospho)-2-C-methyl-D-erythritol kinase [Lachnospiraceae bacterium]
MDAKVTVKGYAKINLGLDVIGKLDNGYHLLRSVMQQIDLYDTVELSHLPERMENKDTYHALTEEALTDNGLQIVLTSDSDAVPLDQSNLAYKAAKLLMEHDSIREGVHIHIIKKIPVAAGLAGGSTDAAAVLMGMNELFGLGHSKDELQELGVKLGADVPFCIMGGSALAEGIGEKLTPIEKMPEMYIVIVKPSIGVSTKYVYENLRLEQVIHPDTEQILAAMQRKDLEEMTELLGNVLESVTIEKYPLIRELKDAMLETGAVGSLMSGSGPTVFGVFDTMENAVEAEKRMRQKYPQVFIQAAGIIR